MIAGQVDPMAAVIPVNNSDKNINNNNSDIRAVTYKAENYYVAVKGSRASGECDRGQAWTQANAFPSR